MNARVAWTGAGVDLRQQRPDPAAIRAAVLHVLDERAQFRRAAARLARAIEGTDAMTSILAIAEAPRRAGPGAHLSAQRGEPA